MHFECPNCHQRLEAENDRAGELLPCPACERSIRIPKAPMVVHKGMRMHGPGSVRLVPIPAASRQHRQGSLAERVAAMKAAKPPPAGKDEPILL